MGYVWDMWNRLIATGYVVAGCAFAFGLLAQREVTMPASVFNVDPFDRDDEKPDWDTCEAVALAEEVVANCEDRGWQRLFRAKEKCGCRSCRAAAEREYERLMEDA